jgi:hypothetical protein
MLDEPLLGEQPEGLTQGRPTDAEVRAQRLLDDLLSGLESAGEDRVPNSTTGYIHQTLGEFAVDLRPLGGHELLILSSV